VLRMFDEPTVLYQSRLPLIVVEVQLEITIAPLKSAHGGELGTPLIELAPTNESPALGCKTMSPVAERWMPHAKVNRWTRASDVDRGLDVCIRAGE